MLRAEAKKDVKKSPDMKSRRISPREIFFFLYFNTLLMGMMMAFPAIIQPAFLTDIVKINQAFAGSINGRYRI